MRPKTTPLRLAVLLGVPLVTAVLELFHPKAGFGALLQDGALLERWIVVHILQLCLFGLMALAACLLIEGQDGLPATSARLALGGFAVLYGADDALAGIGTGLLLQIGRGLPVGPQATVLQTAQAFFDFVEAGQYAWIGLLGTCAWVFGLLAVGVTLARPRWPRLCLSLAAGAAVVSVFGSELVWRPFGMIGAGLVGLTVLITVIGTRVSPVALVLLGISAFILKSGHPAPFGTIAFGAFFLAVLWLLYRPQWGAAPAWPWQPVEAPDWHA